jgi:DNA-binding CsgD family transcriptional regulator
VARLSSATGARLLEELTDLYALVPLEEFPIRVLALVQRLIGSDAASYNEIEVSTGALHVLVDPEVDGYNKLTGAFETFIHEHPVIAYVESTGDGSARTISDFLSTKEFHRLALHGEFFGPLGIEDQLSTTLQVARGQQILGIALNRSGVFTEVERLFLDALRPHLVIAHQNSVHYSRALSRCVADESFVADSVRALDRLTDRQRDVLCAVSRGSTNVQVAGELGISVRTVKKHLEHIFEQLQVQTRIGAARIYLAGSQPQKAGQWWNVAGDAGHKLVFEPGDS